MMPKMTGRSRLHHNWDRCGNPSCCARSRRPRMIRHLLHRLKDPPGVMWLPPPLLPLPAQTEAVDCAGAEGIRRGLDQPMIIQLPLVGINEDDIPSLLARPSRCITLTQWRGPAGTPLMVEQVARGIRQGILPKAVGIQGCWHDKNVMVHPWGREDAGSHLRIIGVNVPPMEIVDNHVQDPLPCQQASEGGCAHHSANSTHPLDGATRASRVLPKSEMSAIAASTCRGTTSLLWTCVGTVHSQQYQECSRSGCVIGHGIGGKDILIMARLAKGKTLE